MKFLIDEDVPVKLLSFLSSLGHDGIRVTPTAKDPDIASRAKSEGRILVSLDHDFANTALYPPSEFNIVHIRIHPATVDAIIPAFDALLKNLPAQEFKGLILLLKSGHIRIEE